MAEAFVEPKEAQAFLEEHRGCAVEGFAYLGEGAWSRCFGFVEGGRELVVRFGRYRDDFENDRRASTWRSPALPVPELLELGSAFDGHFAISTRARGVPLEQLDTAGWRTTLPSLFAALDAMRAVDLGPAPGWGGWDVSERAPFGSWRDFLLSVGDDSPERRTHGWRAKLAATPGGEALFRAGQDRLAALTAEAAPAAPHLIHGDLVNRNVLVADGKLDGIFDWGCSLHGDFVYDVAWLEFWSPWFPALAELGIARRFEAHCDAIGLPLPDLAPRMGACLVRIGLDHLAYLAHTGDRAELARVAERLEALL